MKPIRLTAHAKEQAIERGASLYEIEISIQNGVPEEAKNARKMYRYNFQFNSNWQDTFYQIKQVAPVVKEEAEEIVVITVYTFYF